MKITEIKGLLKDKRVMEEIHKHLWIESQKAGYNIGMERATDEWLRLYAEGWVKFHKQGRSSSKSTKKAKTKSQPKTKKKKTAKKKAKR